MVGGTSEMSKKWKLECTDDDLEWATTLGDLGDKTHPQDSLIDALKKAGKKDYSEKKGLYIAKNLSPKTSDGVYEYQNAVYAAGGDQAGPNVEYCASTGRSPNGQGKKLATVYRPSKLLVLCEKFFTWPTIAKAEELAEQEPDDKPNLDNCRTKGSILLHEVMHMISEKSKFGFILGTQSQCLLIPGHSHRPVDGRGR